MSEKPKSPRSDPEARASGTAALARRAGAAHPARSARGMATHAALLALSRAARSIPLYPPRSASVRELVAEYHDRMVEALAYGDIDLEVRPLELVAGDEIVLQERERERSTPNLLFRDGVRRLTLAADAPWDEIARLLEIVLLRAAPVRSREDDVVTLFGKAGLASIRIVADAPDDPIGGAEEDPKAEVPRDFDLPLPAFDGGDARLAYRPAPEEALAELRAEVAPEGLPALTLRATRELLDAAADPLDPTTHTNLVHLLGEIRDHLLARGDFAANAQFWRMLREVPVEGREVADAVLGGCADDRAVRALLAWSRTRGADLPRPRRVRAELEALGCAPFAHLTMIAEATEDAAERAAALYVLRAWVKDSPAELAEWLEGAPDVVVADLLADLGRAHPRRRLAFAARFANREDDRIVTVVERLLDEARPTARDAEALWALTEARQLGIRRRAIELFALLGDRSHAPRLMERLRSSDALSLSPEECMALGATIGALDGPAYADEAEAWVRPRGLWARWFGRLPPNRAPLYGAVALLTRVDPLAYDAQIRWMAKRADAILRDVALRTLANSRVSAAAEEASSDAGE
jgi:hypothetical protein